ncbi:MAG: circularly permuted type 2 ATP-grasp protein, partial [Candidatus Competibacteraceae bacterium]|nr:circularly permuted type 2 ATP-grasp protein [Candidatus Competibacteraceae bacterium]
MSRSPDTTVAAAAPDPRPDFCRDYRPGADGYDELCDTAGRLRPHWQRVAQQLAEGCWGEGGRQTFAEVQRLLQDNGVTYGLYDDPRQAQRPWVLDPVPLLIDGFEWDRVEAGLVQRVRLLERLLDDLYGPATVLSGGLLPPELVFSHPGFLRPVHTGVEAGRPWLVFHGADLVRLPDGRFRVLNDRTQSPAGAGYALENRILMARALPGLYREAPLRRLAGFLESLRGALSALALHNQEDPRVVVLTRGPASRAYFEHAYLANYLSLSLVEGADLTVRDARVWLKTLGGLKPVDVILRRVEDELCDPLELRGDSLAGVPGLLQAVREGGVALANPLGVALVENPALAAYLPALCPFLLGEELLLEGVRTWWCGDAAQRAQVLARLEELVITTIEPQGPSRVGARLDKQARAQLAEQIQARPHRYVAREPLEPATAPVLEGESWQPHPMVIRGFTVATEAGHRVMPGALARVCRDPESAQVAVREGGVS